MQYANQRRESNGTLFSGFLVGSYPTKGLAEGVKILQPPRADFASPQLSKANAAPEFAMHASKWEAETKYISSPSDKFLHPSYARIIGLGFAALPLILRRMQVKRGDWFYALRAITGADPVPSSMAGDVENMTRAWVEWGKKKQLV